MIRNWWFFLWRFVWLRNINVMIVRGVLLLKLFWENINIFVKNLCVNIVRKCMCFWECWKCIFVCIYCCVNVWFVGKYLVVCGYYRVIFVCIWEKSYINVLIVSEFLLIVLIYECICKYILWWKNIVVIIVCDFFYGCCFYLSISIYVEKGWILFCEFFFLNYYCYLNNFVVDILNFVCY